MKSIVPLDDLIPHILQPVLNLSYIDILAPRLFAFTARLLILRRCESRVGHFVVAISYRRVVVAVLCDLVRDFALQKKVRSGNAACARTASDIRSLSHAPSLSRLSVEGSKGGAGRRRRTAAGHSRFENSRGQHNPRPNADALILPPPAF